MTYMVPGCWFAASRWSGSIDLRPILAALGGSEGLATAPRSELVAAGLSPRRVAELSASADIVSRFPWIAIGQEGYPSALLDLANPPPVIWYLGEVGALAGRALAIVGSRTCTAYGRRIAHRIGGAVATAGGVVVSGAARGIDATAHAGTFGRGQTVAVLGCGLSRRSRTGAAGRLLDEIVESGGILVSEFAPSEPASRWTFPRRNRLVAALGQGLIVVEAGERSGALITAGYAADIGRPILAVPGPLDASASRGTLDLIGRGARCLTRVGDAVEMLYAREPSAAGSRVEDTPRSRLIAALSCPRRPAQLAKYTGLPLSEILQLLALLEITGVLRRYPGQRYGLP